MRIAWLGTGNLGRPMAARLAATGHHLAVWNRTPAKAEPLRMPGVDIATTPRDAVASAECVILMLQDAAVIESVLLASRPPVDLRGRTVIQMATIGPGQTTSLAERVSARGGDYLEAPVLGSIPQAEAGSLIVMVGATPEQFARRRDLLRAFGPDPLYVGAVGQAARLKLALNQLIASITGAFAFSLGLVRRSGIDVELFMRILRQSALYAPTFDKKLSRMLSRDFGSPNFSTRHMLKDVRLVLEEGRRLGLETAGVAAMERIVLRALELGHAEADYSALYEGIDPP